MKTPIVIVIALTGCASEPYHASRELCRERAIGDVRRPVELSIIARDRMGDVHAVSDERPTEVGLGGGTRGLALSIRATNLDGCAVAVVMRGVDREELRGGTLVQLDDDGRIDPTDGMQFVELPGATADDGVDVAIEDAHGRWAMTTYRP